MRFALGCLVGVLLGLLVAASAVAGYLLLNRVDAPPSLAPRPTGAADVSIVIGQDYLTQRMQQALAKRGLEDFQPSLDLAAPNQAVASAVFAFTILGETVSVRPIVFMHFSVSSGMVVLDIDRVNVSGFSLPQELVNRQVSNFKQAIQDEVNAELKGWLANTGLHVVSVEAEKGQLIVKLGR